MELEITDKLAALSHPQRMAIFRLLMRRYPDALPAGEVIEVLGVKPSTASVYLAALKSAGLIIQRREGTRLLYSANIAAAGDIMNGLFMDCCRGRIDLCPSLMPKPACTQDSKLKVLFVCTGNSARSVLAETILTGLAPDRFDVYSTGTAPRPAVNENVVALLHTKGHKTDHLFPKNITEFQTESAAVFDFIITVCDRAANENTPPWRGHPVLGHWGMPDPVETGDFGQCYDRLGTRLSAFSELPLETLDRHTLQTHVDSIGKMHIK